MDVRTLFFAAAAALSGACSSNAFAQADPVTGTSSYVNASGQVVHCASTASGRTYCGSAHTHYVPSGKPAAACIEGQTYGVDDRGVWVSGACHADFVSSAAPVPDTDVAERSTYVTDTGHVVHCVSAANGRTYCGQPHERYVIRGRPDPVCVQGSTWGFDERGVWVTGGCAADFEIAPATTQAETLIETQPAPMPPQHTVARVIHCISAPNGRTYCGTEHKRYTLHGAADPACVEGRTWGVDDRGPWVSDGCRADFEVDEN